MSQFPPRPAGRAQLRALTGAFLARFFENEATVGPTDMRQSFFWLVAMLATPGIFLPLYMYLLWAGFAAERGVAALRISTLLDKTIYLDLTFVGLGLVSALIWHALLPDRRDGLVLGGLPLHAPTIYSSKLLALVGYVALVSVGMHTPAAVLYGSGLGLPESGSAVLHNMAAVFVSASAINVFVLATVTGAQSCCLAVAGPVRFGRISGVLQVLIVATATLLLVLLPATAAGSLTLAHWTPDTRTWLLWMPPIWFLGLYETIAGTSAPVMTLLSNRALGALTISVSLLLISYPLASRRALAAAVEGAAAVRASWIGAAAARVPRWLARDLHERAIVQLLLASLARRHQHRLMIAIAAGVGLAAVMPIAATYVPLLPAVPTRPDVPLLAAPLLLIFALTTGLRIAVALPSELPASWIFPVAPSPMFAGRNAARLVMLALGVAGPLLLVAPLWVSLWGLAAAALHLLACALAGTTLVDALLWGYVGVPCAKNMAPARANLQARWPVFAVGLYLFAYQYPLWQIAALDRFGPLLMLAPAVLICWIARRGSTSAAHANGVSGDPHGLLSLNLNIVPAAPPVAVKERHA